MASVTPGRRSRVAELSRMLAGVVESSHARSHAAGAAPARGRGTGLGTAHQRSGPRWGWPTAAALQAAEITGTARIGRRTKDLIKRLRAGRDRGHRPCRPRPRRRRRTRRRGGGRGGERGAVDHRSLPQRRTDPRRAGRHPARRRRRLRPARPPPEGDVQRRRRRRGLAPARLVATGTMRTLDDIEAAMEAARTSIGAELERFAENTLEYMRHEAKLTFEPLELPPLQTKFKGRHARGRARPRLPGTTSRAAPYIREYQPVLIGVDGGADALLEIGLKPDIIIGDFDSVSERAWHIGARPRAPRAPRRPRAGREALVEWGVHYEEFVAEGTERGRRDAARVRGRRDADRRGRHARDDGRVPRQGPQGMASTFLTRLRLGPVLVDAKGVTGSTRGVCAGSTRAARRVGARGHHHRRRDRREPSRRCSTASGSPSRTSGTRSPH